MISLLPKLIQISDGLLYYPQTYMDCGLLAVESVNCLLAEGQNGVTYI
jgi:hypothetical protein